jgi:NAD(P)-dependent dehydrogenase (short-subunit alcohol dehydrogenase family)
MMAERLLAGERALVTGGASGIGRGIAGALAREGARVVLADLEGTGGEDVAASIRASGDDARFLSADLAANHGPARLLAQTLEALGTLSILVHSASPRRLEADTVDQVSDATWEAMLGVNVRAGFQLGRDAGKHMREHGIKGRMLYITSLHADSPRNLPHYSAAKAGETMVMKELARALGPYGIRVNAIAPGAIPGGGFDAQAAGTERLTRCTSLRRLGTADDVAGMAVALLSERFAAYVTGTTVVVDGGLALHNWIEPPPL